MSLLSSRYLGICEGGRSLFLVSCRCRYFVFVMWAVFYFTCKFIEQSTLLMPCSLLRTPQQGVAMASKSPDYIVPPRLFFFSVSFLLSATLSLTCCLNLLSTTVCQSVFPLSLPLSHQHTLISSTTQLVHSSFQILFNKFLKINLLVNCSPVFCEYVHTTSVKKKSSTP